VSIRCYAANFELEATLLSLLIPSDATQAATDIAMRAQILSYSRSRGIFAGISLEGSTLRPDNNANYVLYGRDLTARQIVRSDLPTPAPARDFIAFMEKNPRTANERGIHNRANGTR
jgi:lipid-binding SYLF domain-containing protein